MGEVYRARDERLGRDIALKVLAPELAASGEHLRRFELEARAASGLNHPNIITIFEIGRTDSIAYIAMEYVEGRDLRTMMAGERLPLKLILRIAVKVADGLAAAHERGIVHRDLKPENVIVSRDGFVKILDFGLAKLARPFTETDSTIPQTIPGAVFGTVGYMSPEQAGGRQVDYRSDQFALGVILYEMLTGKMPFSAPTAAETLAAIIRDEPVAIAKLNDAVPPEVVRIVERCLSKDREDRYASTRDLMRDLREVRDRITSSSEPRYRSGGATPVGPRRVAMVAGIVAGAVALAAGVVMSLRPDPVSPATRVRTVAVLPFKDLTGDPDGQVFADGVTEMIGTQLVQSKMLRVIPVLDESARSSDPAKVARDRGATLAIRGSVQGVGDKLRVSFAVIDVTTREQVGGSVISGSRDDGFALQGKIVESILTSLKVGGAGGDDRTAPAELTSPPDQIAYIQALGFLQRPRDEKSIDRAIVTLRSLLVNARDSALLNAQLARALLYKSQLARRPGLIEEASVYAERAVEIDDTLPEVHIRLGQVRSAAGRYDDAATEYHRALSLRPDHPDAVLGLAETHEAKGRAADAESMYRRALTLRPDHPSTINRYAVFLFNQARFEDAAKNFRRFTELMPTARGFSNLAAAYWAVGKYDEARRAAEQSIAFEPTSDAYVNLGFIYYYSGQYGEALKAFLKATEIAPTSYHAWIGLGDTYRWAPDMRSRSADAFRKAIETTREAVTVNPRDYAAHAASAHALAKTGRLADASSAINTALKVNPTDPTVLYEAAVVALLRGTTDVAISWLERAVDAGYSPHDLRRDPEFKSMHDDPGFRRALQKES